MPLSNLNPTARLVYPTIYTTCQCECAQLSITTSQIPSPDFAQPPNFSLLFPCPYSETAIEIRQASHKIWSPI